MKRYSSVIEYLQVCWNIKLSNLFANAIFVGSTDLVNNVLIPMPKVSNVP